MLTWLIIPLAIVCYHLIDRFFAIRHDAREPPLIPQPVPFIGHMIGILLYGPGYYTKIGQKYPNTPIYSLGVPGSKIYVVTSPTLVSAIDRQAKSVSFAPTVVQFAKRILLSSQKGTEAMAEDLEQRNGGHGVRPETMKVMHSSMAGEHLLDLTRAMLQSIERRLGRLAEARTEGKRVRLFDWVREVVTGASTDSIYGAGGNPLQDPEIAEAFWAVNKDIACLGLNTMPNVLAPRAHSARSRLFQAFQSYYAAKGHEHASRLVQARYEVNRKHGMSLTDIEHFDLSVCFALLVNTTNTMCWAVYYMYSSPALLQLVRDGVSSHMRTTTCSSTSRTIHSVNLATFGGAHPFIPAFIQEILRLQSAGVTARYVLRDTHIENQYLLKKDTILLISIADLHLNQAIWGPTAPSFDPQRFLNKNLKVPAAANRPFGSAATLCPGRHLAANEILILLVVMACRFDLQPHRGSEDGDGSWKTLKPKLLHFAASVTVPEAEVQVEFVPRGDPEKTRWEFSWNEAEMRV